MEIEGITYLNKPVNNKEKKKGIAKIIIIIALVLIVAAAVTVLIIGRYRATTMKLVRADGTVTITDDNGKEKEAKRDMRFHSGDTIVTAGKSVASINMDDKKVVSLEEYSTANFIKKGKQLEIDLEEGGLFFNVKEKLDTDETFEIKTQTMTVGIRGTSGYICRNKFGNEYLAITDGMVHVIGRNAKTGETKEIDVVSGQILYVYTYSEGTEGHDTIEFAVKELTVESLPSVAPLALAMIKRELSLLNRVCTATGWDANYVLSLANGTAYLVTVEEDIEEEDEDAFVAIGPTEVKRSTPTPTTVPVETEETEESNSKNASKPKPTKAPKNNNTEPANNDGGNNDQPAETAAPTPTNSASKPASPTPTNTVSKPTPTTEATPTGTSNKPSNNNNSNNNNNNSKPTATTPSAKPTTTTTTTPTAKPSNTPTVTTTPTVTDKPTETPTEKPTEKPTENPSTTPSTTPTESETGESETGETGTGETGTVETGSGEGSETNNPAYSPSEGEVVGNDGIIG